MALSKFESIWKLMSEYSFEAVSPNENLMCIICKKLMVDACESLCGCHYCHKCIDDFLCNRDKFCPGGKQECKESYLVMGRDVFRNPRMNNNIYKLKVFCPNELCLIKIDLSLMEEHFSTCSKQPMQCPFLKIGCSNTGVAKDSMLNHLNNELLNHSQLLIEHIENLKNEIDNLKSYVRSNTLVISALQEDLKKRDKEIGEVIDQVSTLKREIEFISEIQESKDNDLRQFKRDIIHQVMASIAKNNRNHSRVFKNSSRLITRRPIKRCGEQIVLDSKKRTKQLVNIKKLTLAEWQSVINETYPLFNVIVENDFDNEGPPPDFEFITDYFSKSVVIHQNPPIGCCCLPKCLGNKDCISLHGTEAPYTVSGKVRIHFGSPIYECNKACSCSMSCPYRVVQRGVRLDLNVFRTSDRGWGLKTRNSIKKGTFIIEYLGEIISSDEAEERAALYDQNNIAYLFDLDFDEDAEFTIDAYKQGNLAHFINHSCDPNMTSRCVFINCLDIRLPRIAFFAARDIRVGEELNFDYMMNSNMGEDKGKVSKSDETPLLENIPDIIKRSTKVNNTTSVQATSVQKRVKCLCNSKNCRQFLF